jgi:hypothetical protein
LGPKSKAELTKQGIKTLAQRASLTDEAIRNMKNQGLSKKKLTEFRQEALQCETNAPESLTVDHRKAVNPYMSRYGEGWKQHVKNSCMLKGYIDVRDMVRHIYKKSEELMKGTLYEDRWFFYHDALSLMMAQDTKDWMKEEGILKH